MEEEEVRGAGEEEGVMDEKGPEGESEGGRQKE